MPGEKPNLERRSKSMKQDATEERKKDWKGTISLVVSIATLLAVIFGGVYWLGRRTGEITTKIEGVEKDIKDNVKLPISTLTQAITGPDGLNVRVKEVEKDIENLAKNIGRVERNIEKIEKLLGNEILPRIKGIATEMGVESAVLQLQTDLEQAKVEIQKLKQRQDKTDEFLNHFSMKLRQSINSSLSSLTGHVESLQKQELTGAQEDSLASIKLYLKELQKAVDDLSKHIEALR